MTADAAAAAVVFLGIGIVAAGGLATGYLWGIYSRSSRPPIFRAMIETCVVAVVVAGYFTALTIRRVLLGAGAPDWIAVPNTAAIIALLSPPIRYAWTLYRIRREPEPVLDDDAETGPSA